jgi:sugar phosphate isomerase/epimerase
MRTSQIAAQLFTLREHLKTPADIAASMKKVKEIGYEAVQISGMGPIDEAELVKICDGEGLVICATHEPSDNIVSNPEAVVERLDKLGCKHTAYPHPKVPIGTVDEVKALAESLDKAGAVLAAAGQTLSYHNHALEFAKLENGKTVLETIYDETDPANLKAELDLHWVQRGGGSPLTWVQRYAGRQPLLHLKDFRIVNNEPDFAEIGNGNLDWDLILPAADEAGVEWFIVEQDRTPGNPFDSLAQSAAYLRAKAS